MKIIYLQPCSPLDLSRKDETWGTSQGLSYYWKQMGHIVYDYDFRKADCETQLFDHINREKIDVVVLTHAGEIPDHVKTYWKKDKFANLLMVGEGSDEPQILRYNLHHTMPADLVWSSDLDATKWYSSQEKKAAWIPHWGDELVYSYSEDPCNGIITTAAAGPRRGIWSDAISSLSKEFGDKFVAPRVNGGNYLTPSENNELYKNASINLAISSSGDITRRLFESAVSGRMTICDRLSETKFLNSIFEEGKEIECFSTVDELIEKTRFYLTNHDKRMQIAYAARKKCLSQHTAAKRAQQLTEIFEKCISEMGL